MELRSEITSNWYAGELLDRYPQCIDCYLPGARSRREKDQGHKGVSSSQRTLVCLFVVWYTKLFLTLLCMLCKCISARNANLWRAVDASSRARSRSMNPQKNAVAKGQNTSVPLPTESLEGYEGRFSRDLLPDIRHGQALIGLMIHVQLEVCSATVTVSIKPSQAGRSNQSQTKFLTHRQKSDSLFMTLKTFLCVLVLGKQTLLVQKKKEFM